MPDNKDLAKELVKTKEVSEPKEPQKYAQISEALVPFVDNMHSETKTALAWLLPKDELAVAIPYQKYQQVSYTPEPIENLPPLKYIDNEADFIFLCSKVLKSPDGLDFELFLEALLRYYPIKDSQSKALSSALKIAKNIARYNYRDITHKNGIYHLFTAKLICIWLDPQFVSDKKLKQPITLHDFRLPEHKYYIRWSLEYRQLFDHINLVARSIQPDKQGKKNKEKNENLQK